MLCLRPSTIAEIRYMWTGMKNTAPDEWQAIRAEAYHRRSAGVTSLVRTLVGQRLGHGPTCRIAAFITPTSQEARVPSSRLQAFVVWSNADVQAAEKLDGSHHRPTKSLALRLQRLAESPLDVLGEPGQHIISIFGSVAVDPESGSFHGMSPSCRRRFQVFPETVHTIEDRVACLDAFSAYKPRPGDFGDQEPALVCLEEFSGDSSHNHETPISEIDDHWSNIDSIGNFGTTSLPDTNSSFDDESPIQEPGQRDIDIQWYPAPHILSDEEVATEDPGLIFDGERSIEDHGNPIINMFVDDEIPIEQPGMSFSGIVSDGEPLPPLLAETSETPCGIPENIGFE